MSIFPPNPSFCCECDHLNWLTINCLSLLLSHGLVCRWITLFDSNTTNFWSIASHSPITFWSITSHVLSFDHGIWFLGCAYNGFCHNGMTRVFIAFGIVVFGIVVMCIGLYTTWGDHWNVTCNCFIHCICERSRVSKRWC